MSGPVLITGGTGFIGRALVGAFHRRGEHPYTLSRGHLGGTTHRHCDLTNPSQVESIFDDVRPLVIVHLAGATAGDGKDLYTSNVVTTVNVMNAAGRLSPIPLCLLAGSAAEYGETSDGPIRENASLRPVSEYGRVKVEQTVRALEISEQTGVSVTILRPFNIVDPNLPKTTALGNIRGQLLAQAGRRRTVRCGRLDIIRDFVSAEVVAEAFYQVVQQPLTGRVLNVCSGVGIQLGEIVYAMGRRLDVELDIDPDPDLWKIPGAKQVVGDPSALRRELGISYEPTADSLAEVLVG